MVDAVVQLRAVGKVDVGLGPRLRGQEPGPALRQAANRRRGAGISIAKCTGMVGARMLKEAGLLQAACR